MIWSHYICSLALTTLEVLFINKPIISFIYWRADYILMTKQRITHVHLTYADGAIIFIIVILFDEFDNVMLILEAFQVEWFVTIESIFSSTFIFISFYSNFLSKYEQSCVLLRNIWQNIDENIESNDIWINIYVLR